MTAADAGPVAALFQSALADGAGTGWDAAAIAAALDVRGFGAVTLASVCELRGAALLLDAGDDAELVNLAVDAAVRRRGLGRAILRFGLASARNRGANRIVLEVAADNRPAMRLYVAMGFVQVGRRRGYYAGAHGRVDALIMATDT